MENCVSRTGGESSIDQDQLVSLLEDVLRSSEAAVTCVQPGSYWLNIESEHGGRLWAYLQAEPALAKFDDHHFILAGGVGGASHMNMLAAWLITIGLTVGSNEVVRLLASFLDGAPVRFMQVALIDGLRVEVPVQLTADIFLLPIEAVPLSDLQGWVEQKNGDDGWSNGVLDAVMSQRLNPKVALVRHFTEPSHFLTKEEYQADPFRSTDRDEHLLHAVALLMTVIGPSGATLCTEWTQRIDELPGIFGIGRMMGSPRSRIVMEAPVHLGPEAFASLPELLERFLALAPSFQKLIVLAIDRLNSSIRKNAVVDKVIDLGIAMESLLLDGKSDDGIAFPFRLRGAHFLGGDDLQMKVRLERLFNAMYGLRSQAVHNGEVVDLISLQGAKVSSLQVIRECQTWCAKLICAFIMDGHRPNWTSLVLGGDR
jgi:hypothetical protein